MNPSGNGRAFVYQHHGMVAGLRVPWVGSWGPVPEDKGTRQREHCAGSIGLSPWEVPTCRQESLVTVVPPAVSSTVLVGPREPFPEARWEEPLFPWHVAPEILSGWRMLAQRGRRVAAVLTAGETRNGSRQTVLKRL